MNTAAILLLTYLLNALWQVPLVYVAALLLERLARPWSPAIRHRLWIGALAAEIVLPALNLSAADALRTLAQRLTSLLRHARPDSEPRILVRIGPGSVHGTLGLPRPLLLVLAALYLAITAYFFARLLWRLHRTQRLRLHAHAAPSTPAHWLPLAQAFRVPSAELAFSSSISGPVTLGIRRRLLLLPPSFAATLPDEDLAAALAHEFAHMARRDFAKNLAYQVLSLPIAFHPFLHLTLAHLSATREIVCDASAAAAVSGPERYAHSLLRLAASLVPNQRTSTLHAIGIFDAHTPDRTLETRIMTLTAKRTPLRSTSSFVLAFTSAAIILGTCTSAMALHLQVAAPLEARAANSDEHAARISGAVMAGQILTKVQPVYPTEAKDAKITGAVVLHAIIGMDGTVENLTVISGPEPLRASAIDAVRQWVYKPYILNGNPVEVDTTITVNYNLGN